MPHNDLHQDPNHPHNLNHLGDIVNRIRTIMKSPHDEVDAFTVRKEDLFSTDSLIEKQLKNLELKTETLIGDSESETESPVLRVFSETE